MNPSPRAIVIRTAGTNCDREMVRSFQLAGASCDLLHIDRLVERPALLDKYDLIGFPGGFSHGDDVGAGRIFSVKIREHLYPALVRAHQRGAMMIGICNGFQVLVQTGLLPGREPDQLDPVSPPEPTLALGFNSSGRLIDDWPRVEYERESVCVWTKGLAENTELVSVLPLASGEGRLVAADESLLNDLQRSGQIVLRYAEDINGSARRIAGVCDPSGRTFGLMPHPDRYLEWTHHPYWTRLDAGAQVGDPPGLRIFKNAVKACQALEPAT